MYPRLDGLMDKWKEHANGCCRCMDEGMDGKGMRMDGAHGRMHGKKRSRMD